MQARRIDAGTTAILRPIATPAAPTGSTTAPAATASRDLDGYYATAQGKTGAELLRALHTIISTGHRDLGYSQAREALFADVADTDGDNMVPDLFTGELRGPIDGKSSGQRRGFNTEHTWPQSKGATGIAKSDLHHLHPSVIHTNSQRGHLPYGDVVRATWTTGDGPSQALLGVDALGTTVFEPGDQSKGDIARGLLYFYARYAAAQPGRFTTENFRYELLTLLKWNAQDPVDATELLRNDAVQRAQGNRNPFVDRPEFVELVDFTRLQVPTR